jgi:hypothetical protein
LRQQVQQIAQPPALLLERLHQLVLVFTALLQSQLATPQEQQEQLTPLLLEHAFFQLQQGQLQEQRQTLQHLVLLLHNLQVA